MLARRATIAAAAVLAALTLAGCVGDDLPAGKVSSAHKSGKFWQVCVDAAGQQQCHKYGVLTSARHCHTGDQWPACRSGS